MSPVEKSVNQCGTNIPLRGEVEWSDIGVNQREHFQCQHRMVIDVRNGVCWWERFKWRVVLVEKVRIGAFRANVESSAKEVREV